MVVIPVAIETLSPNFNEAPEFNAKLPSPESTCPYKSSVPFTVNVFPAPTVKSADKVTTSPEVTVILLALVGTDVAVNHEIPL